MHYDILDEERQALLPKLAYFQDRFYLAGGTGLALQLGHRDSEDFDFFSADDFDAVELIEELQGILAGYDWKVTQEEKNTVSLIVAGKIKLSFFAYPYPLLEPLIEEENLKLASLSDIACMKLSAIVGRATMKDYVDLYFILQKIGLTKLLELSQKKMPTLDRQLILKSLVYFDDVLPEQLKFKDNHSIDWTKVQEAITKLVKQEVSLS